MGFLIELIIKTYGFGHVRAYDDYDPDCIYVGCSQYGVSDTSYDWYIIKITCEDSVHRIYIAQDGSQGIRNKQWANRANYDYI
jgi:hypothetical protein